MDIKIYWKLVHGFPDYEISNTGLIRNAKNEKILREYPSGANKKYRSVSLWTNKVCFGPKYIHRLVLETFLIKCPLGKECAHIDGNPSNNNLNNLKWVTPKENSSHKIYHGTHLEGNNHPSTIIKDAQCLEIIEKFINGSSVLELSVEYKVTSFRINHILRGRRKTINISNKQKVLIITCVAIKYFTGELL